MGSCFRYWQKSYANLARKDRITPTTCKSTVCRFHRPLGKYWDKIIKPLQLLTNQLDTPEIGRPPFIIRSIAALDSYEEEARREALKGIMLSKHPSVIDVLAEAVHHHLPDVSMQAAFGLIKLTKGPDSRAIPGLIEAIQKGYRQFEALNFIGKLRAPEAIPTLVAILDKSNSEYGNHDVIKALVEIGEPVIPVMLSCLNSENHITRFYAMEVLGKLGDPNLNPWLLPLLDDKVESLRLKAIETLMNWGDDSLIPDLLRVFINDKDIWNRAEAARSLGKLKSFDAIEHLVNVYRECNFRLNSLLEEQKLARLNPEDSPKSLGEYHLRSRIDGQNHLIEAIIESLLMFDVPEAITVVQEWRSDHPDQIIPRKRIDIKDL